MKSTVLQPHDLAEALALIRTPQMGRALEEAKRIWSEARGRAPEGAFERARLASDMERFAYVAALISLNSDPTQPRLTPFGWPSTRRFGLEIPGSGICADNQDNIFFHVPIDGALRYAVRGRCTTHGPSDFSFQLAERWPSIATVDTLAGTDVVAEPDGSFVLTIDSRESGSGPNHLRSIPGGTGTLQIRETLGDWAVDRPHHYTIEQLTTETPAGHVLVSASAERAADLLVAEVTDLSGVISGYQSLPENSFAEISVSKTGLQAQTSVRGHFKLDDDQALVVTADKSTAAYFNIQLYDEWLCSTSPDRRNSGLNHTQAPPSADGSYRFAISATDPGVKNWLDSANLNDGFVFVRWQGFPRPTGGAAEAFTPSLHAEVVKVKDVATAVGETERVTQQARQQQLVEREQAYWSRFL